MPQWRLAERAGTSQQWVSRVERGDVDVRLADAERLFAAAGARLQVRAVRPADDLESDWDPDLILECLVTDPTAGVPDAASGVTDAATGLTHAAAEAPDTAIGLTDAAATCRTRQPD
jgi:transcriptional regulator with XRE-family HTH domain